jgi:ribosomal protein S18 acetylase RimI-like enzyme
MAMVEWVGVDCLPEYARVPMRLEVREELAVVRAGLGGIELERKSVPPYVKDYDRDFDDGGPLDWPAKWDVSNWGIAVVRAGGEVVAGAAVAWNTAGTNMLEGATDLAALWDLRVHPSAQRRGLGRSLVLASADWARARGCKYLKIETQNNNLPACLLYASLGAELTQVHRAQYRSAPVVASEVMLVWWLRLS